MTDCVRPGSSALPNVRGSSSALQWRRTARERWGPVGALPLNPVLAGLILNLHYVPALIEVHGDLPVLLPVAPVGRLEARRQLYRRIPERHDHLIGGHSWFHSAAPDDRRNPWR